MPDGKSNHALDAIATRRVICCEEMAGSCLGWLIYMNMLFISETASRRTTQALSKPSHSTPKASATG